jgi:hypothetical protein
MQMLPTLHRLIGAAGRIGADPADSSDIALQKRVLVGLALIPAPAGIIWGIIYIAAGARLGGFIPAAYTFVALANTALFGWTHNVRFFRFSQLFMILVLPWLMMLSLGGFKNSSVVIVWSVLSPPRSGPDRGSAAGQEVALRLHRPAHRERISAALSFARAASRAIRHVVLCRDLWFGSLALSTARFADGTLRYL